MNQTFRDRVILPFAIPVGGMLAIGIPVWAFSRILLAVGKDVAVMVALFAAADILVIAAVIASRPPDTTTFRLAAAMGGLLIAIGFVGVQMLPQGGGAAHGEAAEGAGGAAAPAAPAVDAKLVAENIEFDQDRITLPANAEVKIELDNQDAGTEHNVAIFTDDSMSEEIFEGRLFRGSGKTTYQFTSPAAGEYYFVCTIHPNMNGTVVVE